MSKQTAVEWLYFQLIKQINPHGDTGQLWETLQKAKAMEKEQIINSHIAGMEFIAVDPKHYVHDANNYYNSEYKGGEQCLK